MRIEMMETSEWENEWTAAQLLGGGELHGLPYAVHVDDPALPATCRMTVTVEKGRLVCTALELTRRPDQAPITGELLRRVPVATYLQQSLLLHPRYWARVPGGDEHGPFALPTHHEREIASGLQSEDTLTQVVAAYRNYLQQGIVRGARQAVARELGLSVGHVSRLLSQARGQRLLLPTEVGAGGARTHRPDKTTKKSNPKKRTR